MKKQQYKLFLRFFIRGHLDNDCTVLFKYIYGTHETVIFVQNTLIFKKVNSSNNVFT